VLITPRVVSSVDETRQMTADYARQFESLAPLRAKNQATSNNPPPPPPQPAPAETYPTPEKPKSQEDLPRDH
jgi:general secretion pathway protein D